VRGAGYVHPQPCRSSCPYFASESLKSGQEEPLSSVMKAYGYRRVGPCMQDMAVLTCPVDTGADFCSRPQNHEQSRKALERQFTIAKDS
jgi:hypothetical protein